MTSAPRVLDAHAHVWTRAGTPQRWIDPDTMAAVDRPVEQNLERYEDGGRFDAWSELPSPPPA